MLRVKLESPAQGGPVGLVSETNQGASPTPDQLIYTIDIRPDERPTCRVKIGTQIIRALIDSGAQVSLLNAEIFTQLPTKLVRRLPHRSSRLKSASGDPIPSIGVYNINIHLGEVPLMHTFHVVKQLKQSALLGADFLAQTGAILDCGKQTIKIHDTILKLIPCTEVGSLCRLPRRVRVPPQTAMSTRARLNPSVAPLETNQVYEISSPGSEVLDSEPGIGVMNGLAHPQRNTVPVVLINTTGKTFQFERGMVIAQVHPVNLGEVTPIGTPRTQLNDGESKGQTHPSPKCVKFSRSPPPKCTAAQEINSVSVQTNPSRNQHHQVAGRAGKEGKWRKPQPGETSDYSHLNIGDPELTQEQLQPFLSLIDEFDDTFSKYDYDIGRTHLMEVEIKTGDSAPIKIPPYRTPAAIRPEMARQIAAMLESGVISESQSPWSCPLFAVPKKGNKLRFVVNYDPLNKVTEKFYWPLTQIDQILTTLSGTLFYSSVDISHAFHQIPLKEEDRPKSAFVCSEGLYEYNTLAFGLTNAPSIFSQLMDRILNGIKNTFVTSYADDILIYSKSFTDHLSHLRIVLERIRGAGLKLNKAKCEFFKPELEFLGHVVTREGIKPQLAKVEAIQKSPRPHNLKSVRSFLGLSGYYRRYIPRYSEIARPLTSLTKKHAQFCWTDDCQRAFDTLKKLITTPPVLVHPDPNKSFTLWTDASAYGTGGVLCQVDEHDCHRPVHFLSGKFTAAQRKWSTYEREFYAVVKALSTFRPILYGRPFTVFTDHAPLTYIRGAQHSNPKVQRWATTVAQYGCEIRHVSGRKNGTADFLSRIADPTDRVTVDEFPLALPKENDSPDRLVNIELDEEEDMDVNIIDSDRIPLERQHPTDSDSDDPDVDDSHDIPPPPPPVVNLARWGPLQRADPRLAKIINLLDLPEPPDGIRDRYALLGGRLHFVDPKNRDRLVVPLSLQDDTLYASHEGHLGAHLGSRKMYASLCRSYFWSGMYRDVLVHCDRCIPCNTANLTQVNPPLQETPVPKFPFETVSIDLYGPLPKSLHGNEYIITAIDQLTGWVECEAIPDKSGARVCRFLMHELISRHSVPLTLMSDNGTEFVNEVIHALSREIKMVHIRCANYAPQSNGKCERIHRDFTAYFRKLPRHEKLNWDIHMYSIVGAYRCADHASAGKSPFYLLYGRDPVYPVDTLLRPRLKYHGDQENHLAVERMHRAWRQARKNIKRRALTNREYHNRRATFERLEVGDPVYIYNHRRGDKFDPKFTPHGRITQKLGPYKFKVRDLLTGKISRLTARSLRKATESAGWGLNRPLPTLSDRPTKYVVEESDTDSENSDHEQAPHSEQCNQTTHSSTAQPPPPMPPRPSIRKSTRLARKK